MTRISHSSYPKFFAYLAVVTAIVIFDQVSKQIAYDTLLGNPPVELLPMLRFVLVFNEGAAFGFLNDAGGWQHYFFSGLALIVSAVLFVWLWRSHSENALVSWGLALILGGAIGNLIDRLSYQHVIDFISVHYQGWQFPAFNIADSAITVGAVLLIADMLGVGRNQGESSDDL